MEMDRDEIIEKLAYYFGLEPDDETGEYDLDSYDWQAGCSMGRGGMWLNLANVVDALTE